MNLYEINTFHSIVRIVYVAAEDLVEAIELYRNILNLKKLDEDDLRRNSIKSICYIGTVLIATATAPTPPTGPYR